MLQLSKPFHLVTHFTNMPFIERGDAPVESMRMALKGDTRGQRELHLQLKELFCQLALELALRNHPEKMSPLEL